MIRRNELQLFTKSLFSKWGIWMKPKTLLIIGIILLTNLLTFTFVKIYFPTTVTQNYYLLKLKGKGEHWLIEDYQIAYVPGKDLIEGSETVTYLGNPTELKGGISLEIYDYFKDGTTPHSKDYITADSLRNGSFTAGGGGGTPSKDLSLEGIINYSKIIIRWTTNDGIEHEESIKLELDLSPHILHRVTD
jgi:hypothetical protein